MKQPMLRGTAMAWGVCVCLTQLAYGESTLKAGPSWITNAHAKLELLSQDNEFGKRYQLLYYRRAKKDKTWTVLIKGDTPVVGMGYNLLAGNIAPTWVKTKMQRNKASLTYRLDGYSTIKPKAKIWVEYTATLLVDSPCVIFELSKVSDKRLRMMCHMGAPAINKSGVSSPSRYVFYDKFLSENSYTIEFTDASQVIGSSRMDYKYARFTAQYDPKNDYVFALLGIEEKSKYKQHRIGTRWGVGFSGFSIYSPCALFAARIEDINDVKNVAHYIENQYYEFREKMKKSE